MQFPKNKISQFEFVALMAALMSVTAISIDALLPALDVIGEDINTQNDADNQLLITMIFLGLGVGPLLFGPLSDAFGRKPSVYIGLVLFTIASFMCVNSNTLELMVAGRILQGIGLAAPRTVVVAIIRDLYNGDYMARIMSFVTVVFLLVPIVAPASGQLILDSYSWEVIFYVQIGISAVIALWFALRQRETLPPKNRIPLSATRILKGFRETLRYKKTLGFTLISGFVVGSFLVYLSASQQIFQNQYGLKEEFPYIFAGLAVTIGISIFLNANLVVRFGMEKMVTTSLLGFFGVSVVYLLFFYNHPQPNIYILLGFISLQFFLYWFSIRKY